MTPFALLAALAGLSHREASELLSVRLDTVKSWSSGRNRCPPGALAELKRLIARQERAAREALAMFERAKTAEFERGATAARVIAEIELGYPADDDEARTLGWPCVGAWGAMAARVIAGSPAPVSLAPALDPLAGEVATGHEGL